MNKINDLNIMEVKPLITPQMLKYEIQNKDYNKKNIYESRDVIKNILDEKDFRIMAIVGPCSIHDIDSAIEYAEKLNELREKIIDKIYIIMRVYFEKPRTTLGWKGLITDPNLDGSYDIEKGLKLARKLLAQINAMGMPCATEMLDPVIPQYIADFISWAAIGARTTESQTHRELASGLSFPIGFKNSTTGNIDIAINAIISSRQSHHFIGIDKKGQTSILKTSGNKYTHLILRGSDKTPNYYEECIESTEELIIKSNLKPNIIIDCSHGNSSKQFKRQKNVLKYIIDLKNYGNKSIKGFMLESNLKEGNQVIPENKNEIFYGQSVTDACIGWQETEEILLNAYNNLMLNKKEKQCAGI
ncbi:MAG: 3-deoxy-7-phosphoheptulonate synthase [Spirochaetes bacterium]|nr:3-deoxy-7-phosphoheptulonate synthase [Spirochaetota bacterium]